MTTHSFKGLTGIDFEVNRMQGKHQRLVSQKENGIAAGSLNVILADLIIKIGSIQMSTLTEKERIDLVKRIPSEERKKLLFEIRQLTNKFKDEFVFTYKYKSKNLSTLNQQLTHSVKVPIMSIVSEKAYPYQSDELDTLLTEFEVALPESGETYKYNLNNGYSEEIAASDKNPSSHTLILMRQPKLKKTTNKQGEPLKEPVWLITNADTLDKMEIDDIETLRFDMKEKEGRFNSIFVFDHPEAHLMGDNKEVSLDLLQLPVFYFPLNSIA